MKKTSYIFSIHGCDDSTEFVLDCTEEEYAFIYKLQAISKNVSTYGCMPTIEIDSDYAPDNLKKLRDEYNNDKTRQ